MVLTVTPSTLLQFATLLAGNHVIYKLGSWMYHVFEMDKLFGFRGTDQLLLCLGSFGSFLPRWIAYVHSF